MFEFKPGPERVTPYFCKQCERQQVSGAYAPGKCTHCECIDFYSEFDTDAPCNRHGEEENEDYEEPEYYYDGEMTFEMRRAA